MQSQAPTSLSLRTDPLMTARRWRSVRGDPPSWSLPARAPPDSVARGGRGLAGDADGRLWGRWFRRLTGLDGWGGRAHG